MFENFLPGISVPFVFLRGISGIFGWMFRFKGFQQFLYLLETFPENFHSDGKRPMSQVLLVA